MNDVKPLIPHAGTCLPTVKTSVDCTKPRRNASWIFSSRLHSKRLPSLHLANRRRTRGL